MDLFTEYSIPCRGSQPMPDLPPRSAHLPHVLVGVVSEVQVVRGGHLILLGVVAADSCRGDKDTAAGGGWRDPTPRGPQAALG